MGTHVRIKDFKIKKNKKLKKKKEVYGIFYHGFPMLCAYRKYSEGGEWFKI